MGRPLRVLMIAPSWTDWHYSVSMAGALAQRESVEVRLAVVDLGRHDAIEEARPYPVLAIGQRETSGSAAQSMRGRRILKT